MKAMRAEIKPPQFRLIWTRADAFPTTSHVGNAGSTPAGINQPKALDTRTRIDLLPPALTLCWQRV